MSTFDASSAPLPAEDERLTAFARRVRDAPFNLVSRAAREELHSRHVPESVAFARSLPAGPARVLDLGSGGGFPGVVIAVVREDLAVELLEATAKKVAFLREAVAALDLEVPVHHGRAEELVHEGLAGRYDLVTARAVAPLASLVGLALPFLAPDGRLYAVKGDRWAQELDEARPALARAGGVVVATPEDAPPAGPVGDATRSWEDPDGRQPRTVVIARGADGAAPRRRR